MSALSRPLVVAFLAFLSGLLPALRFGPSAVPLLVLAAVCLLAFLLLSRSGLGSARRSSYHLALLGSFVFAGATVGANAHGAVQHDCRSWIPDGTHLSVRGVLAANSIPLNRDSLASAPLLPLLVEEVRAGGRPTPSCGGEFRVRIPEEEALLLAGTEVRASGPWIRYSEPVVRSEWPHDPRYRGFLAAEELAEIGPPRLAHHPLLTLRGQTELHLRELFPRHGPLAEALLLGRREYMDPAIRERFTDAGLAHLLAISGMHVGLIAGILLLAGRAVPGLRRLSRKQLAGGVIGCIAFYLAMIGAPASAVRAGVMISLALTGIVLQRPFAALPIVVAAAFVILLRDPAAVLGPGFQLSFAGVLGILALREVTLRQVPAPWRAGKWRKWTVEALVVSVAAFVATAPIVAWHFGSVAPIAVVANLPAIPVMSVALTGIVLATLVGPWAPPLGSLFAYGAGFFLDLLDWIAGLAAGVPYGHAGVPRPQAWLWLAAAIILFLALDAAGRLRPRIRWTTAGLATAAFLIAWPVVGSESRGALELHFLDVGQGDAIAIRTPARRWILIDAGPRSDRYDAGERRVLPFLRAHGVRRLEALVLTHPDADHMGGIPAVVGEIEVGRLVDPGHPAGKPLYLETLRQMDDRGIEWTAARGGRTLRLDGVALDLLWPEEETLDRAEEANEISVVIRLRYQSFSALLPGDAPDWVEEILVERHGASLRAEVLKAGHHGSYTSTSERLLDAVRPQLVVISAGRRNRYGHPAPEVLRRLNERGIPVARTDREGTISIRVDPDRTPQWRRIGG